MSNRSRDKAIFNMIKRAYDFEFEQREKLDTKLNNYMAIVGSIATINIGIGFFIFERISARNSFYPYLTLSFIVEVFLFASTMVKALQGYSPMDFYYAIGEPVQFIEKYKDLTEIHLIREVSATMAEVVNLQKRVNILKTNTIRWIFRLLILAIIFMGMFAILMILALGFGTPIDP